MAGLYEMAAAVLCEFRRRTREYRFSVPCIDQWFPPYPNLTDQQKQQWVFQIPVPICLTLHIATNLNVTVTCKHTGFEISAAVNALVVVFCFVARCGPVDGYQRFRICCLHPYSRFCLENGGNKFYWNFGSHLQKYTLSQPRRPQS
jgi:hypothetical protein